MSLEKSVSVLRNVAESTGLEVVSIEKKSRHFFAILKNEYGQKMLQPFQAHHMETGRDILNIKGQFKRFSRGQTHGLRLIK